MIWLGEFIRKTNRTRTFLGYNDHSCFSAHPNGINLKKSLTGICGALHFLKRKLKTSAKHILNGLVTIKNMKSP
jgi:hypothetical protein